MTINNQTNKKRVTPVKKKTTSSVHAKNNVHAKKKLHIPLTVGTKFIVEEKEIMYSKANLYEAEIVEVLKTVSKVKLTYINDKEDNVTRSKLYSMKNSNFKVSNNTASYLEGDFTSYISLAEYTKQKAESERNKIRLAKVKKDFKEKCTLENLDAFEKFLNSIK